jgi:nucleoside-diphosphate-sugar epimerase
MLADIERAMNKRALVRLSMPFSVVKLAAAASEQMGKAHGQGGDAHPRQAERAHRAPLGVRLERDAHRARWEPKVKWPEGTRLAAEWYRANGWL